MNNSNPKVVIITGASSGIGAAVARRLARDGTRLTLAARREDRLKQVAADVESLGSETLIVPVDIQNHDDIRNMVQATLEHWGQVDVLFNNAGVEYDIPLPDLKYEKIRQEVHINLISVIECAQVVIPVMLQQKTGHIINVASLAGLIGVPGSTIYSATKFGVNGFTDALHRELLGSGVHVSAFCPGYTPTELTPRLKAHLNGEANAPHIPGLMPVTYVADQVARLIRHPRLRVIIPPSWRILVALGQTFPGFTDSLIGFFRPKDE